VSWRRSLSKVRWAEPRKVDVDVAVDVAVAVAGHFREGVVVCGGGGKAGMEIVRAAAARAGGCRLCGGGAPHPRRFFVVGGVWRGTGGGLLCIARLRWASAGAVSLQLQTV
jgi:hypothetical protein